MKVLSTEATEAQTLAGIAGIGFYITPRRLKEAFDARAAISPDVAFTALTGGTSNALDGLVTANGAVPTNSVRSALAGSVGGGDLSISWWVLVAGTNAEDGVSYVRPDDYDASTNARIWVRVG